jgi:hypothetical protein
MMDKKLIETLKPIEEKFDVSLMTDKEALEFVDLDRKSLVQLIDEEIDFHRANQDFINGMEYVRGLVNTFFQARINEGY